MLSLYRERQRKRVYGSRKNNIMLWSTLAMVGFIGLVVVTIGTAFLFLWYAKDLPRPDKIKRSEGYSTVVLDRNGVNLYDIYEGENRVPVIWEDIPANLKDATIAIEDKEFYKHPGLSTAGIGRALVNIFIFRNFQGGSTLTQQLVKTVLLSSEQTLPRKMKEAILAIQIERKYTKNEILQMYLNEVPYGGPAVGVEAAAQYYFGKPVRELTLTESVILAGLPQSPSRLSPFGSDPEAYIYRSEQVARRMREDGYIPHETEEQIKAQLRTTTFADKSASGLKAPHFVAFVREQLVEKYGEKMVEGGGLKVTTTLDSHTQNEAQKIVAEEVTKAAKLKVTNGSAVVIDPKSGEILAMVGSKDYNATDSGGYKFNVATQGLRQPGSAIKPLTYAAAFKKGYTPASMLMDVETKYPSGEKDKPEYNPKNYDGKYRGPMQLRFGLGNSINTVAVKISALTGIRDVLKLSFDMGLTTLEPTNDNLKRFGLSLTLGGGEVRLIDLTSAFGVFANGGIRHDPVAILKVEDTKGQILYEYKKGSGRSVLSKEIAFLISDILSDNTARRAVFGERSLLVISGKTVAVKTGTTDDKRDNWTVGFTPSVVVGTWVGNNDNSPMNPSLASGITGASPIWSRIIKELLKDSSDEPFIRPDGIVESEVDSLMGGVPIEGGPRRKEFFIRGTEPTGVSPLYQRVKISRHDNSKLANAIEIARGEYDEKEYIIISESDPISTDDKNRWQEGIDAWVGGQDDARYKPPKDTYSGQDASTIAISIKEPGNEQRIDDNAVRIKAEATGLSEIVRMELFVDGAQKGESGGKNINELVGMTNGIHTIKITARDSEGKTGEREIRISVNEPFATETPAP